MHHYSSSALTSMAAYTMRTWASPNRQTSSAHTYVQLQEQVHKHKRVRTCRQICPYVCASAEASAQTQTCTHLQTDAHTCAHPLAFADNKSKHTHVHSPRTLASTRTGADAHAQEHWAHNRALTYLD
jgi:hypothetical protein